MGLLECDVLIVGAGPAGLSVASTLPDDIRVIIVHQDAEIGLPVRTSGACWAQDVARLGIPPDMAKPMHRYEIFADREQASVALGDVVPVILDTPRLYKWLAQQSDHKDRRLMLATKFVDTKPSGDGRYVSTIRARGGATSQVMSKYIVDGSGWHFAVLSALGLVDKPERLAVGTEYEYPLGENANDRVIAFFGARVPAGYGWAFPTAQNTLRVGVGVIQPDTDKSPRALLDDVVNDAAFLKRLGLTLHGDKLVVHSGILPSVAYDTKLVFGTVIRVGDSANFATPTIGEGIRVCIELGRELGVQLGRAIKTGSAHPLKAYERKCRRVLKRDYKWGFRVNRRAASYTPAHWDAAVRRMGYLDPAALVATFRGEFPPRKIALMIWTGFRQLLRARVRRIKARFGG